MGFKPLHDGVLLRRVGEEEKSAGGIIIPDTAQEKPSEGVVVAVGSGVRADDGSEVAAPADLVRLAEVASSYSRALEEAQVRIAQLEAELRAKDLAALLGPASTPPPPPPTPPAAYQCTFL